MSELDLSPFKVEFDREITFNDIIKGDICILRDGCFRKPEGHYLFIYAGINKLERTTIYRFIPLMDVDLNYTLALFEINQIKAIYRINKFKY